MGRAIMPKFISDDEMAKLEQANPSPKSNKKVISDDEMMSLEEAERNKPGYTESGLRGLAQGASFGFADELTGLLESALTDKSYEQARDESRANYKAAEEANPKTYLGGQIGGAVGTALVPGLQGAGVAKLAAMGAAQGLGSSEADLLEGDLAGAAKDTAIGGTLGAATGLAGKGIQKLLPSSERVAQGLIDTAEDISNPLANLSKETLESGATIGQHSTIPGKMFGGSQKIAQVANAIGDIPETMGAGIREGGTALSEGNLSGVLKGLGKTSGFSTLGELGQAVTQAGAPKTAAEVAKPLGQKALDYGVGAAVTGKASAGIIPGIAAGAKIVGKGLDAANKAAFNAANNLSIQSVEQLAPKLGKYGQVLMSAAARGADSLASTNFILQQTDPEYSKKFLEATGAINDNNEEQE